MGYKSTSPSQWATTRGAMKSRMPPSCRGTQRQTLPRLLGGRNTTARDRDHLRVCAERAQLECRADCETRASHSAVSQGRPAVRRFRRQTESRWRWSCRWGGLCSDGSLKGPMSAPEHIRATEPSADPDVACKANFKKRIVL